MNKYGKYTSKEFKERARKVHGNKYDYSKVNYRGRGFKITIVCKAHGKFKQDPHSHLRGYRCPSCGNVSIGNILRQTTKEFIRRAKKVHGGKYGYSLVDYKSRRKKVAIQCKIHGVFYQVAHTHLEGCGCKECMKTHFKRIKTHTLKTFIKKSQEVHGLTYDYSKSKYKRSTIDITIICKKHGPFKQKPVSHLGGSGCPTCKQSWGERMIHRKLDKIGVDFESQKRFKQCKDIYRLPFDFYVPKHRLLIEFNGPQHYAPIKFFGGIKTLTRLRKHDSIKKRWARINGYKLKIITYKKIRVVDKIIERALA